MKTHKVHKTADGSRYVALIVKPYQGHSYSKVKSQQNRTERLRSSNHE